jgi:hypothetical protein
MDFLKTVGGKVAGGAVLLAVVICGIGWYQAGPDGRAALIYTAMKIVGWTAHVLAMPWLLFPLVGWVESFKSNHVSGVFLIALTALQSLLLLWLFQFDPGGAVGWMLFVAGVGIAGVYNLLACDWLAEKLAG